MNDYRFGNYLTKLRRRSGMTQQLLAYKLGITDKAVSKWENGRARPSLPQLRKLAELYSIPLETLLSMKEKENSVEITKIVITGGPCAGKTTAMSWIEKEFGGKGRGYTVLFVPETATELITGGVAPWTCGSNLDYQKCQVRLQKEKEAVFEQAARTMPAEKVLIVCDRGVLDNKAYMNQAEFDAVMRAAGTNEVEERDGYDGVFHMVTAAKGALEAYTLANNAARTETPEQAAELDDKIIAAWTGHPHLRIIDNSTGFEGKLRRLLAEIASLLGEPEPMETERKYLIRYPDIRALDEKPNCEKIDIIQTYLKSPEGREVRVRQRGQNGNYVFFRTEKRRISDISRAETERRITPKEYVAALIEADPLRKPIQKTRYCLTENNTYYEIDIYPGWSRQAIMEIELRSPEEEVIIPDGIKVIREVTQEEEFSNYQMAREMPPEK
ncbi:MAG: AAA family ATPase [Mogibacterium sp.]|nr:AAA family ATPase [Mogibacterium sp.]